MTRVERFIPVAEAIARLLHPHAEVVIHDVHQNCIAAIFNSISHRRPGDPSHIDDLPALVNGPAVHGPFDKCLADGRRLRYVTSILRDDGGSVVALLCINLDISVFEQVQGAIQKLIGSAAADSSELDAMFDDDWQDRIHTFVHEYLHSRNRSLAGLERGERVKLVHELRAAGAFRVKNAASFVARVLGVSRATVYNYLADTNGGNHDHNHDHDNHNRSKS